MPPVLFVCGVYPHVYRCRVRQTVVRDDLVSRTDEIARSKAMAWWIAGVLAVLLVLFFSLYWRALTEARQLVNLYVLVLLEEKVYGAQRTALLDFIAQSNAKNAAELGTAVNLATTGMALRMKGNTLGVAGILWKAKSAGTKH